VVVCVRVFPSPICVGRGTDCGRFENVWWGGRWWGCFCGVGGAGDMPGAWEPSDSLLSEGCVGEFGAGRCGDREECEAHDVCCP